MRRRVRISAGEARRIAFAAQGFDRPRPEATVDARHLRRVLQAMKLLQLDFVNVLIPAHYLMVWSRLGPYDRERFHRFIYEEGNCTEQWAHEASIVPVKTWPLLAYRRASFKPWKSTPINRLKNRKEYLDNIIRQMEKEGGLTAHDLPPVPGPRRKPGDWHRSVPRWALEYHFGRGAVTVANRLPNFQRVYDLPERVIPDEFLKESLRPDEARRELLRHAATALGVATLQDLADYYRMTPGRAAPQVATLVRDRELQEVSVAGWDKPAFLSRSARAPRQIEGASLLSPFDPMVWCRPRAQRLFDFHYRIEIYVPAAQRKWGYYVLPFRVGDRVVARVDLKADRKNSVLCVNAAHEEAGHDTAHTVAELACELQALSRWLELGSIRVRPHNSFARQLQQQL